MRLGGGLRLHTGGHPLAAIGTEQGEGFGPTKGGILWAVLNKNYHETL